MTHWTDHERRRLLAEAERLDHEHMRSEAGGPSPARGHSAAAWDRPAHVQLTGGTSTGNSRLMAAKGLEHTNAPGASSLPGAAGAGVSALSPASAPDLRHGTLGPLMSPRRHTANCPIPPRNRFGRDRHDDSDGAVIAALVVIAAIALPVLGGLWIIAHMWGI